jgi:hypothetical protein
MPQRASPDDGRLFPPFEIVIDHYAQEDHLRAMAGFWRQFFEFVPRIVPHPKLKKNHVRY